MDPLRIAYSLALRDGIPVDFTRPPPRTDLNATQCSPDPSRDIIGYLYQPATSVRFDLKKSAPVPGWMAGRDPGNHMVISGERISKLHFGLKWNGQSGGASRVTITDFSSNGTFINGLPLGHGHSSLLENGDRVTLEDLWDQKDGYIFYHVEVDETRPVSIRGAYVLGNRLGCGPFGTVYHALEVSTRNHYAIKIIDRSKWVHNDRTTDLITVRDLEDLREMQKMRHKNIVGLDEIFMVEQDLYLVWEHIEGAVNLREFSTSEGPLDEELASLIILQVCHAVSFLHHIGIVVGNIKPENILLRGGDPANIAISDVGLASLIGQQTLFRTMSQTANYLAPETVNRHYGLEIHDKVDSWSIGALTFYLLTQSLPFTDELSSRHNVVLEFLQRDVDLTPLKQGRFSQSCIDFVDNLLMENPLERISIEVLLHHQWLN